MTADAPTTRDEPTSRAFLLAVLSGLGTIQAAVYRLPTDHPLRAPVLSGLGTIAAACRRELQAGR